ncbi:hypothetical protein, partial [Xanthomonas oryzae]|uniref:hypothetical protein n=1 Tax=Xanthomonas oryzae TaxID=347 RepID=UPI00117E8B7A
GGAGAFLNALKHHVARKHGTGGLRAVFQGRLISPDPQLDFCCSPANSFVLPMFSMTSDSWRC